jgi:uncharacterized membrane protein YfcA
VVFALLGGVLATILNGKILKKSFGGFLIFLSIYYLCHFKRKTNSKSLKKSKKI